MVVHLCTRDDSLPENWNLTQDGGSSWITEDESLTGLANCYRCTPYCGLQQYGFPSPKFGPRSGRGVLHFNCQQNVNLIPDTSMDRLGNCLGAVDFTAGYTEIQTCKDIDLMANCTTGLMWNAKLGKCANETASTTAGYSRNLYINNRYRRKKRPRKQPDGSWKKRPQNKRRGRKPREAFITDLDHTLTHPINGTVIQISPRPVGLENPEDASEHFFYGFKIFEIEVMTLPICSRTLLKEDDGCPPDCPTNPCLTGTHECSPTQECITESLDDSKVELKN